MIDSRTGFYGLALSLALLPVALQAQTPGARERVSPEGPYRSQVRIIDETRASGGATGDALAGADDYGKALLLRQLALEQIANGDDVAAIAALEDALALESLAPLATAQMQANLGQLYLARKQPARAAPLLSAARQAGIDDARLAIAHASAEADIGNFATAAAAAMDALAGEADAPDQWLQLAVYALAHDARPGEAIVWQRRLLARDDTVRQRWVTLAGLYQRAGQEPHAVATLSAAAAGGIALTDQQQQRLVVLLANNGLPDLAADQLETLIAQREEQSLLGWLAQLRLEAHNESLALAALERLATLSGRAADWLRAAEYALRIDAAGRAIDLLRHAAAGHDDGPSRARALLLLGQTYLETGDTRRARTALEQASAYGGSVYRIASQWLEELPAQRTAEASSAASTTVHTAAVATAPPAAALNVGVDVKTVPALRVFGATQVSTPDALSKDAAALVRELLRASRRDRIEWTGPLQIVVAGDLAVADRPIELSVIAPIRRVTPTRGKFSARELDAMRCAWTRYEGPWSGLEQAWRDLYTAVVSAGYSPSAEARQVVLHRARGDGQSIVELQVGIR